jgi:hypothetical protein
MISCLNSPAIEVIESNQERIPIKGSSGLREVPGVARLLQWNGDLMRANMFFPSHRGGRSPEKIGPSKSTEGLIAGEDPSCSRSSDAKGRPASVLACSGPLRRFVLNLITVRLASFGGAVVAMLFCRNTEFLWLCEKSSVDLSIPAINRTVYLCLPQACCGRQHFDALSPPLSPGGITRERLWVLSRHQSPGIPHLARFREMWDTAIPTLKPAAGP